ncbi:uncharacterized protein LOC122971373 isoform X2 [Scomber scombrus]|uniref:Uncharacterized protein LOC122971373 isoform X2 n=1 Tax=Scomber scombrus TaxID=13677 RepID=A0AAV1QCG3_SCOSC
MRRWEDKREEGCGAPEVILGLDYSEQIDMWSLGLIAAEVTLGFSMFPGSNEYDVMKFIVDTLAQPPDHLLNCGQYSTYYFNVESRYNQQIWNLKTPEEYAGQTGHQQQDTRPFYIRSLDVLEDIMCFSNEAVHKQHLNFVDLKIYVQTEEAKRSRMCFPAPKLREIPTMAPELLIVIVASVSCVVFCIIILTLVTVLCRKDPLCCGFRPHRTEHYTDESPQYNSRHSLIGINHNEHNAAINQGALGSQLPGGLFIIGMPNDYHLGGPLPRLPSYESVRKKDRQRHIHNLIANRFGLSGCPDELALNMLHHNISFVTSPSSLHQHMKKPFGIPLKFDLQICRLWMFTCQSIHKINHTSVMPQQPQSTIQSTPRLGLLVLTSAELPDGSRVRCQATA